MAAAKQMKLGITVNLKDSASHKLRALGGELQKVGQSGAFGGIGKSVTALGQNIGGLVGQLRGVGAAAGAAFGPVGAIVGVVGSAATMAFGKLLDVVMNVAKALWDFAKRVISYVIKSLLNLIKYVTIAGIALGAAFTRSAINAFADYEQAVVNAVSVTGLMGDEFKAAKDELFEFGLAISRFSSKAPKEIAQGFYAVGSSGFDVDQIKAAMPGIVALAEGTGADMAATTELATSTLRGFGMQAKQMPRVVNVLAATVSNSRMNIERLSVAMPYVSASAKAMGLSLEQTSAALGVLVNNGLKAESAGTGLRMMLAKSSKVTSDGIEELKLRAGNMQVPARSPAHGTVKVPDVTVTVNGNIYGVDDLQHIIADAIRNAMREARYRA